MEQFVLCCSVIGYGHLPGLYLYLSPMENSKYQSAINAAPPILCIHIARVCRAFIFSSTVFVVVVVDVVSLLFSVVMSLDGSSNCCCSSSSLLLLLLSFSPCRRCKIAEKSFQKNPDIIPIKTEYLSAWNRKWISLDIINKQLTTGVS